MTILPVPRKLLQPGEQPLQARVLLNSKRRSPRQMERTALSCIILERGGFGRLTAEANLQIGESWL